MVKERSLAGDLAVYMSNIETSIPALKKLLDRFQDMSGQRIKVIKSAILLLGRDAQTMREEKETEHDANGDTQGKISNGQSNRKCNRNACKATDTSNATTTGERKRPEEHERPRMRDLWEGMTFCTIDDTIPKYHGIRLANGEGAQAQWRKEVTTMTERIDDDAKVFCPRSIQGRASLAEARYINKVAYGFKYQVPETEEVREILSIAQSKLDTLVIGKCAWIQRSMAGQRKEDGGIALPDIRIHMGATWAHTIRKLLEPQQRPWKSLRGTT